jgi:hypothetical protein
MRPRREGRTPLRNKTLPHSAKKPRSEAAHKYVPSKQPVTPSVANQSNRRATARLRCASMNQGFKPSPRSSLVGDLVADSLREGVHHEIVGVVDPFEDLLIRDGAV